MTMADHDARHTLDRIETSNQRNQLQPRDPVPPSNRSSHYLLRNDVHLPPTTVLASPARPSRSRPAACLAGAGSRRCRSTTWPLAVGRGRAGPRDSGAMPLLAILSCPLTASFSFECVCLCGGGWAVRWARWAGCRCRPLPLLVASPSRFGAPWILLGLALTCAALCYAWIFCRSFFSSTIASYLQGGKRPPPDVRPGLGRGCGR